MRGTALQRQRLKCIHSQASFQPPGASRLCLLVLLLPLQHQHSTCAAVGQAVSRRSATPVTAALRMCLTGAAAQYSLPFHATCCCSCYLPALQIFVEIERARLTRRLAAMKESEGNIAEAADILQVQTAAGSAVQTAAGRQYRQQQAGSPDSSRQAVRTAAGMGQAWTGCCAHLYHTGVAATRSHAPLPVPFPCCWLWHTVSVPLLSCDWLTCVAAVRATCRRWRLRRSAPWQKLRRSPTSWSR